MSAGILPIETNVLIGIIDPFLRPQVRSNCKHAQKEDPSSQKQRPHNPREFILAFAKNGINSKCRDDKSDVFLDETGKKSRYKKRDKSLICKKIVQQKDKRDRQVFKMKFINEHKKIGRI